MNTKATPVSAMILNVLKNSAIPLTRVEIQHKLPGLTTDQVRKGISNMVGSKKLVSLMTTQGVPEYRVADTTKLKPKVKKAAVLSADRQMRIIEGVEEAPPETGEKDLQAAYMRGYNDGVFHANRDGYNAGRKAVLKGLTKMLGINAEILL